VTLTGLLGAVAAPLVGLLAERVWGGHGITDNSAATDHQASTSAPAESPYEKNIRNARALENALLSVMITAMLLRAIVYGILYFTLTRDRVAAQGQNNSDRHQLDSKLLADASACSAKPDVTALDLKRWSSYPPHVKQKKPLTEMQRFVSVPQPLDESLHV